MRADEVQTGMVIDYRGTPALVVLAWSPEGGDEPLRGITDPCGFEIEWTDENGMAQRTRLVWPSLSVPEKDAIDSMGPDERQAVLDQRLSEELDNQPVELWVS